MEWFTAEGYWLSRLIFQRGLALVYLVAFLSTVRQFRPLLGTHGLTPIPRYLASTTFRRRPSVFHLYYSDRFFAAVAWTGVVVSAALLAGLGDDLPLPAHMAVWGVLWGLYVSIVNVGQTWYGFGWETLLCEVGFIAIFLGPAIVEPPLLMLLALRWVLFRVEFGAGLIKLRGDQCWRDLTCLYYHHETQPMPNPLSWHFHNLPRALHRFEVAGNHGTQLVVPFLLFLPQPVAGVAAAIIIVTQAWLVASGNFSWLNVLTIVLALPVIADRWWNVVAPVSPPDDLAPGPIWHQVVVFAVAALIVLLSIRPLLNLVSRQQLMNHSYDPLHLVNTYGAFGSITRVRHEIVIEGTTDSDAGPETDWREYEFKGKPGDVSRRPRQYAPYHLRLDWLMWFAALSPAYGRQWFRPLLNRLLAADPATLRLLRHDPFDGTPPAQVRALTFRYRFTTRSERRRSGAWWERTLVGEYHPPVRRRQRGLDLGD